MWTRLSENQRLLMRLARARKWSGMRRGDHLGQLFWFVELQGSKLIDRKEEWRKSYVSTMNIITKYATQEGLSGEKFLVALKDKIVPPEKRANVADTVIYAYLKLVDEVGLNPWLNEVCLIPSRNSFSIALTVDGWSTVLNRQEDYLGMTFEYGEDKNRRLHWIECIMMREGREPLKVREYMDECNNGRGAWQTHPKRMLRHRSIAQAARLCFGIRVAEVEEVNSGVTSPAVEGGTAAVEEVTFQGEAPPPEMTREEPPVSDAEFEPKVELEPEPTEVTPEEDFAAAAAADEAARESLPPSEELFPEPTAPPEA